MLTDTKWAQPFSEGARCGLDPVVFHIVMPFQSADIEEKVSSATALMHHLDQDHRITVVRSGRKMTELSHRFWGSEMEVEAYSEVVMYMEKPRQVNASKVFHPHRPMDSVSYEDLSWWEMAAKEVHDIKRRRQSGYRYSVLVFTGGLLAAVSV